MIAADLRPGREVASGKMHTAGTIVAILQHKGIAGRRIDSAV